MFHNALTIWLGFLLLAATPALAQRAVISLDDVQIYSLPMVDDSPLAMLSKGDTVKVIGRRGGWVKVAFGQNRSGWMQIQIPAPHEPGNGTARPRPAANGKAQFASNGAIEKSRDIERKTTPDKVASAETVYRRFGYSFGMGLVELDYTYNWKFVFHSKPRLALEGSFKHVLGDAADSYFITANLSYMLNENKKFLPYVTAGLGVVNTAPNNSIDTGSVSHMAINYGVGARKFLRPKLALVFGATQYTTFVGKGARFFNEITIGLLVGKFWD